MPAAIASCTGFAHENTAWKIRNITTASTRKAEHRMQHDAIDRVVDRRGASRRSSRSRRAARALRRADRRALRGSGIGVRGHVAIEPLDQRRRAAAPHRDRLDDRHAEPFLQQRGIDADAATLRPRPSC